MKNPFRTVNELRVSDPDPRKLMKAGITVTTQKSGADAPLFDGLSPVQRPMLR